MGQYTVAAIFVPDVHELRQWQMDYTHERRVPVFHDAGECESPCPLWNP